MWLLASVWGLLGTALLANPRFQKNGQEWALEKHMGHGRLSIGPAASMRVRIDAGWYSFAYGAAGTMAYRSFAVCNSQVVQLEVTSCFCLGNVFSIFDNGQPILTTDNQATAADCTTPITVPQDCSDDPDMSKGSVLLLPGCHNISIVAVQSPYMGGTAFLRVDTACPNSDFSLPPIPCCEALDTCSQAILA